MGLSRAATQVRGRGRESSEPLSAQAFGPPRLLDLLLPLPPTDGPLLVSADCVLKGPGGKRPQFAGQVRSVQRLGSVLQNSSSRGTGRALRQSCIYRGRRCWSAPGPALPRGPLISSPVCLCCSPLPRAYRGRGCGGILFLSLKILTTLVPGYGGGGGGATCPKLGELFALPLPRRPTAPTPGAGQCFLA